MPKHGSPPLQKIISMSRGGCTDIVVSYSRATAAKRNSPWWERAMPVLVERLVVTTASKEAGEERCSKEHYPVLVLVDNSSGPVSGHIWIFRCSRLQGNSIAIAINKGSEHELQTDRMESILIFKSFHSHVEVSLQSRGCTRLLGTSTLGTALATQGSRFDEKCGTVSKYEAFLHPIRITAYAGAEHICLPCSACVSTRNSHFRFKLADRIGITHRHRGGFVSAPIKYRSCSRQRIGGNE